MNEEQLKPILEKQESKNEPQKNLSKNEENETISISDLPEWSIEPPIEIKRGNE